MRKGGHARADAIELGEIEIGDAHRFVVGELDEHAAPGIDDHRVAIGAALGVVLADLCGGEHEDF